MSPRHSPLVFLVGILLALSGCAGGSVGALAPVSPEQFDARVALADPGVDADPIEHARTLIQAEWDLGRSDRAVSSARLMLGRAEAAWWAARFSGDTDAIRDARRTRSKVAREALRWARRTDDPGLTVAAVVAHPHPRRHQRALRNAVVRLPYAPTSVDLRVLSKAVGNDAAARRQITRWAIWNEELLAELGLETIEAAPDNADLLRVQFERLRDDSTTVAQLMPQVHALLIADPWHVGARLLRLAHAEIEAGHLDDDATLANDLSSPETWATQMVARLHLRAQTFGHSHATRLAEAAWLLHAGLVGDALGALEAMPIPTDDDAAGLRLQLLAMTAARRGDVAAFERWRITSKVSSPSLDAWIVLHATDEPGPHRDAARRARGRLAMLGQASNGDHNWNVMMDERLPASVRARARDALTTVDDEAVAWEALCQEQGRDASSCHLAWLHAEQLGPAHHVGMLLEVGRTPHFHPAFINDVDSLSAAQLRALTPLLSRYAGTRTEASLEFQSLRLHIALAQGEYATAREILARSAPLLFGDLRTWATLAIDDLEADRLDYDTANSDWVPVFDPSPPLTPEPTAPATDAPTRMERYALGMRSAFAGHHAQAVELLLPVLDAVPDAAVTDGLAQASLSAHLSADAPTRDALRLRLHTVDPHGVGYALLQARISLDADQPEVARRFLTHAMRWNPGDDSLYRAVVAALGQGLVPSDAEAMAYLADAQPAVDYHYAALRRRVRDGTLPSLSAMTPVLAAIDGTPQDAWKLGPKVLTEFRYLTFKATRWVRTRILEAKDAAEAKRWAIAGLELLEVTDTDSANTHTDRLWMTFMAGRTTAGLALARDMNPQRGRYPSSEGDTIVQLLQAHRAGEIDDALAWDLWRWGNEDDPEVDARVQALLLDPPAGTRLQVFACGELTTVDDLGPAFPVCEQAWKDNPQDMMAIVSQSFLALNHPEPEKAETMAAALFGGPSRVPHFADMPNLAAGNNLAGPWHQNRAIWLSRRGQHQAAADSWWQAYAFGIDDDDAPGQTDQLPWRGPLIRALARLDDDHPTLRHLDIRRATWALMGGDPVAAGGYAEAAGTRVVAERGTLARPEQMLPDRLRHVARWARADLEQGRLPAEVMPQIVSLLFEPELATAQQLHRSYPTASLTQLALVEALDEIDDDAAARPVAEALLVRHPNDPLAVATALPLVLASGDENRARALFEASDAAHPRDALLRHADVPEAITGPRDGVPAWVRDPARFDARMATVTTADARALVPRRHTSDERAAQMFVPAAWQPVDKRPLRFVDGHGARMMVLTSPRASRCQGVDCARDLLAGIAGGGRTRHWMRQTPLAGAQATQAMFTNSDEVLVAWVIPSGGRVFTLVLAAPVESFDAMRPALVLLRDGFAPLDGVLPPFAARSLRAAGSSLSDGWRWQGRHEQGEHTDAERCPVPQTLAALEHDTLRAELLVDLWLATPQPTARRSLLHCTAPRDATARRIALLALLDDDPRAHAFGRDAVRTHPSRVDADTRTILSTPLTPPVSAPDYLMREDLPGRGLAEVLGALPLSHARPMAERLRTSKDPRDRTLAWAAMRLRPALASDIAIAEALAGEPRLVVEASYLLADRGEPADAQRLRERLDTLPPAADDDAQQKIRTLARALASFIDPADASRMHDLHNRVSDGDDSARADRTRETLRELAADHQRAYALWTDPTREPGDDDDRPVRWRDARRRRSLPIRPESDLRERSLAQLLPGHDYTFARLDAPGLFSSTVADVAERLTTGDEAVDQRMADMTGRLLRNGGFAALSASGGLDTRRPIECAKPAGDAGWLCTASVTDRNALLGVLGQRDYGDDAGLSLPLSFATTAGVVPMALSLLPAIMHIVVYPEEDDESGDEDDEQTPNITEAEERVRHRIDVGAMQPWRYSIVEARTRDIGIDSERYLFVGDKLWVFSTKAAMDRVMRAHEGPTLSDDPEFQRLTSAWKGGSALQAVSLGRAWPLGEGGAAMEVVLDEGGLRFRYSGAFESETGVRDIGSAIAQLPDGALTTFAHGLGSMPSLGDEAMVAKGPDAARVPPLPVLAAAQGLAFGWYLGEDEYLWRRWLAVAPLDDGLRKALRTAKTPPGRGGKSRRHGDSCYLERDGFVLIGDCEQVEASAARPTPPPSASGTLRVAHGTFDGPLVASHLPTLDGLALDKSAILRAMAPVLGVVTDLRVEAQWSPAERVAVLEGNVALRLRPAGDHTRVIDDWLAATEGENAATLPRRVRGDELDGPLHYVVQVPDAEAFVRHTLADSPRVQAEVVNPTQVRMTVSPVPSTPRPTALEADEHQRLTSSTENIRSTDPAIVELAASLAPPGTEPAVAARKISRWVHERITYEVTPRSLDGVEILEAGRGDCTEYSRLTVTLLRAAGVPAQMRNGMAASGDELVAHAWVGYHDGTSWHEIDPTWGRDTVTAGHLEMSVLDALALISLGKLQVVKITSP